MVLGITLNKQQPKRYHELPKRTGTDRNGPERTETDRNGLSWIPKRTLNLNSLLSEYRNGLSGNRNGPERTETDFRGYRNGLSEYRNGLSGNRNGPERTETDFRGYQNENKILTCSPITVICRRRIDDVLLCTMSDCPILFQMTVFTSFPIIELKKSGSNLVALTSCVMSRP